MPYLVVENFNGGLDTRRHVLVSKPGTLAQLTDAHVTRGGEIEKRKAFVPSRAISVDVAKAAGRIEMRSRIYTRSAKLGGGSRDADDGGYSLNTNQAFDYVGSSVIAGNVTSGFADIYYTQFINSPDLAPNGDGKFYKKSRFCLSNRSYTAVGDDQVPTGWDNYYLEIDFVLGTRTTSSDATEEVPFWPGAVEFDTPEIQGEQIWIGSFEQELRSSELLSAKYIKWEYPNLDKGGLLDVSYYEPDPPVDELGSTGNARDPSAPLSVRQPTMPGFIWNTIGGNPDQVAVARTSGGSMQLEDMVGPRSFIRCVQGSRKAIANGEIARPFGTFYSWYVSLNMPFTPEDGVEPIGQPQYNGIRKIFCAPPFSFSPSDTWPVAGEVEENKSEIEIWYNAGNIPGVGFSEISGHTVNLVARIVKRKLRKRIQDKDVIVEFDGDEWIEHSSKLVTAKLPVHSGSNPNQYKLSAKIELPIESGWVYTVSDFYVSQVLKDGDGGPRVDLPPGTFGLESVGDRLYTFTSQQGITRTGPAWHNMYVARLVHPKGASMTGVKSSTVFGGRIFVVAEFDDGTVLPFYGPSATSDDAEFSPVNNFVDGVSGLNDDLGGILDRMRSEGVFSQVENVSPGVYEVSTTPSLGYNVTSSTTGLAAVSHQETQVEQPGSLEVASKGSFTITNGSDGSASIKSGRMTSGLFPGMTADDRIMGIYVGTVGDLTSIALLPSDGMTYNDFVSTRPGWNNGPKTAHAIARYVNNNSSVSGYSATYWIDNNRGTDSGYFKILAPDEDGETANGREVWFELSGTPSPSIFYALAGWFDIGSITASPFNPGRSIVKFGTFAGGALNAITSVKVDGVEVMSKSLVRFQESSSFTAQKVAESINESSTLYQAVANGPEVIIQGRPGAGDTPNGNMISVAFEGNIEVGSVQKMSGGKPAFSGVPQKIKMSLINKGEPGDKFSFTLTPKSGIGDPITVGAGRVAGLKPGAAITFRSKVYLSAGSVLYFSGLNDATKWGTFDLGSGFIDMSNSLGERDDITAMGIYQDRMAIFTRRNVQIWIIDVDSTNNEQSVVLLNTGCLAAESVTSVGASDVLYLSESGIRSLRAREGTDTAFSMDIGSAVDTIVRDKLTQVGEAVSSAACSVIDPKEGRFMMSIGSEIFVLSYYPGSNISAWSRYVAPGVVEKMVSRSDGLIFMTCFSDDDRIVYCYGGRTGMELDAPDYVQVGGEWVPVSDTGVTSAVIELPYLDAQKPATYKSVKAIDLVCTGLWEVSMGMDHTNPNARDVIARISQPSYAIGQIPAVGTGTHIGIKLVSTQPGPARLSNFIVHYDDMNSKHDAG